MKGYRIGIVTVSFMVHTTVGFILIITVGFVFVFMAGFGFGFGFGSEMAPNHSLK